MQPNPITPHRATRIRGRRWLLFEIDLAREIAWPLCMGRSRDWLMLRARGLDHPVAVEIDSDEANAIARRGAIEVDNQTVAGIARQCRCSKRYMADLLKIMVRESRTDDPGS